MTDRDSFLDTVQTRATDREVLEVILYLSEGDPTVADRIWRAPTNMELIDVFVILSERGLDAEALRWGPLGYLWSRGLQELL